MKEYKPTARQLEAAIDPTAPIARKLELRSEVVVTLLLIKSLSGKSSSTTDHCF